MKKEEKIIINLSIRYILLLFIAFNLNYIYQIFTPLTLSLSNFLINFFYSNSYILNSTSISVNNSQITLIPACIAGSAYLFLIILNLSTKMSIKKRIGSLISILSSFLIVNSIRISFLAYLFDSGKDYFNLSHEISWYLGSTLILLLIWFVNIKLFKIKDIPIFTDSKYLLSQIKNKTKEL